MNLEPTYGPPDLPGCTQGRRDVCPSGAPAPVASSPCGLRLLGAALLGVLGLAAAGCIQDGVVVPSSIIQQRIEVPPGFSKVGIRVDLVGSGTNINRLRVLGPFPASGDLSFVDVEGDYEIVTRHTGRQFVAARGVDFDLGWGIVNVPPGGGETVDRFEVNVDSGRFPPNDPLLTDSLHQLVPKTPSTAVFILFEADFGPVSSVDVVGDFNDFDTRDGARPLFDDGSQFDIDPVTPGLQTSGDRVAGDGVWTRLDTDLESGELLYGFITSKDDLIRRDPHEEKSDDGRSIIIVK